MNSANETAIAVDAAVEIDDLGTIVTIAGVILARRNELAAARLTLGEVTDENLEAADELVGCIARHNRSVEAGRKVTGRPYLDATKAINEAAAGAMITADERALVRDVAEVKSAAQRRRVAAERERARAAAEAEAAAAKALHDAEEAARALAEMEAQSKNEADAEALAELRAESFQAAEAARAESIQAAGTAWLAAAVVESTPVVKTGTTTRRVKRLVIHDHDQIPRTVNGIECMVPENGAITRLLKANVAVPGCAMEWVEEHSAGRRR